MQFNRVHVEVTNICGLACSFCPPKTQGVKTMDLFFFEKVLQELHPFTKTLAFHLMGDPLTLSNLVSYLDLAQQYGFEVELTTSGYYLAKTAPEVLFHKAVRQLNISLNSYNKNSSNLSFDAYMEGVFLACESKLANYPKPFINLRLWNLDEELSEDIYNQKLFEKLEHFFQTKIEINQGVKSFRLASKILLNFDSYFEWPTLKNVDESHGFCYGLQSHIGILADGRVVPCCLDGEGVMELGNLHEKPLSEMLSSQRAEAIVTGFAKGIAVEELCRKCTYKERFKKV